MSHEHASVRTSRTQLQGVFFAIAAFTCFVAADVGVKAVGHYHLPAYEVVAFVALIEVALLVAYTGVRGQMHALWPKRPGPPLLRSGLDLLNNLCVVVALRHLPLALFYIMVFLAPAVTTLLEAVFLKEPLGRARLVAVAMGFAGVVIAVDPRAAMRTGDRTGYLACLVCVACFSVNMVWSRRITQGENAQSLTFFSALVQASVGLAMLLGHAAPLRMPMLGLLAGTAAVSMVGGLCFFVALRSTSAATVSQYHYTQLLTGAVMAYLIWREKPTTFMLVGAVLIVASGWLAARLVNSRQLSQ